MDIPGSKCELFDLRLKVLDPSPEIRSRMSRSIKKKIPEYELHQYNSITVSMAYLTHSTIQAKQTLSTTTTNNFRLITFHAEKKDLFLTILLKLKQIRIRNCHF